MKAFRILFAVILALGLTSCGEKSGDTADSGSSGFAADAGVKLDGQPITVANVTFTPPANWKDLGSSGMRQAVYAYGPTNGESDSATMIVFYFGPTGGGGVQDNIARWLGQMSTADGGDVSAIAKQSSFEVDGMKAHWVEVTGTYNASMGGGGMPGGASEPKNDYLMAAAVLEGPQGNLFFKLTGPQKTAAEMVVGFKAMMAAVKKTA
ncbi:MAG: hypothetical protein IPH75_10825 [bacterium]|nr:hypothetical protein [bacterium]